MNVGALLTVHPAWSEVAELDLLITHVSGLPPVPPAAAIQLPDAVFPSPLKTEVTPPSITPPPPAGSDSAAAERISRLSATLKEHSDRVIQREREALEKRLEADVAVERARIREQPAPTVIARTPEDERELRKLQIEAIAVESQVRILTGDGLRVAQERWDRLLARIKELQAPPEVREEVRRQAIEKELETFRSARRAELEKTVAERSGRAQATANAAVSAYRQGLAERLKEAAAPAAMSVPAPAEMPGGSLPSPARTAVSRFGASGAGPAGTAARLDGLRAQRARLVRVITDDLRRRIEGMATQYHWTLVPSGQGADLTYQAADLIRAQFKVER